MYQMLSTLVVFVAVLPIVTGKIVGWYAKRQVEHSKRTVTIKLKQFQDVANTYTEHGTPEELQNMIEQLEEVMEEIKFLEQN